MNWWEESKDPAARTSPTMRDATAPITEEVAVPLKWELEPVVRRLPRGCPEPGLPEQRVLSAPTPQVFDLQMPVRSGGRQPEADFNPQRSTWESDGSDLDVLPVMSVHVVRARWEGARTRPP